MTLLSNSDKLLNDLIEAIATTCSVVCAAAITNDEKTPGIWSGDLDAVTYLKTLDSVRATLADGVPRVDYPPFVSEVPGAEYIAIEPLSLSGHEPETVVVFAGDDSSEVDRAVALVHALATETASELMLLRDAPVLASAFAEAESGVTIADPNLPDNPLIYVNDAFARMTGYEKSELLGSNCRFLQGHCRGQPGVQRIRNALARGVDCTAVLTNFRRDGTSFQNKLKLRPVRTDNGAVTHVIGIQVDVTAEHSAIESLESQMLRYNSLVQTETNYIWHLDANGNLKESSQKWLALAGLSSLSQSPDLETIRSVLSKEAADTYRREWEHALANVAPFNVTYELHTGSQAPRWFVDHVSPVVKDDGELFEWLIVSTEITELKRADQNLQQIIDAAPTGMIVVDREGSIKMANTEAGLQFDYSIDELTGMNIDALVPSTIRHQHRGMRETYFAAPSRRPMGPTREVEGLRKDGSQFPLEVGLNSFGVGENFRVIAAFTDATEIKQARDEIERAAFTDQLTGLLSSKGFAWLLNEQLRKGILHPASLVVIIDIKALRAINNTRGYDVGDEVLCEVARRLKLEAGARGLAARTGGDEFTLLMPIENRITPRHLRQRLTAVFDAPIEIRDFSLHVEATFGYARIHGDGNDAQKLMNDAALGLHQSQNNPALNWTQYTRNLERQIRDTVEITNELRVAVENGELALFYQPKVDLLTGQIVSAEALLRWFHPEKGLIPPDQFIPLAEQSQLIGPIGDWILHQACRDILAWRTAGLTPTPVSVNLSLIQFQLGDIPHKVNQALIERDLSPDDLFLEITESVFEKHGEALKQDLQALSDIGVGLALDDFGTGYSSLSYLKHYPFDEIKIDKSFISQLKGGAYDEAIIRAVITIAKAIDANVVAEGIESDEQLAILRQLGCTTGQGFFFSRPLPESSWRQLLFSEKKFA